MIVFFENRDGKNLKKHMHLGLFLVGVLLIFLWSCTARSEGKLPYILDAGDTIRISVFGEDDLSMDIRIDESNTASYPFLGEIKTKGNSVSTLEAAITKGLKGDYLVDPIVSVTVLEYRKFFINGEVNAPGGYAFEPGLTIQKAIAMAGGFTERASTEKVRLQRTDLNEDDGLLNKNVRLTERLQPGDIITVKASFF